MSYATAGILCLAWITISYLLIAFNKYLMTDGGFPYAAALGAIHGITCTTLAGILLILKPSLFPTLMDPEKRALIDRRFMLTAMLPICLCFTVEIILGNQAYKYLSLAFLQMLKETNVVLVYLMALAAGMEKFTWTNWKLLMCICMASFGTMKGELHFTWIGFSIQMLCCVTGSFKITLQGVLLNSQGMKFDALSYIILVMPICAFIQLSFLGTSALMGGPGGMDFMPVPTMAVIASKWHLLVPNALLAFTLNVTAVAFIKASSSVTYVLAGIVKDMVIVLGGVIVMGDVVSNVQSLFFTAQLGFLMLWSMAKMCPAKFENGIFQGVQLVLTNEELPSKDGAVALNKDGTATTYGAADEKEKTKV